MENRKKYQVLAVIGLMMFLLGNTWYLWNKLDRLEVELSNVRGAVSSISFNDGGLEYRLMEEIRKGASFIDYSETKLNMDSGKFLMGVSIVPKKIQEGDRLYIVSGSMKVEAQKNNEVNYTASVPIQFKEGMEIFVVMETAEGTLQEKLPEIYLDQYLSIQLSSMGITETKQLELTLEALTEESTPFLDTLKDIKVTVYDRMEKEVLVLPLKVFDQGTSEEVNPYGYGSKSFRTTLPESLYDLDYFMVKAELNNYGVRLVSEPIYQYTKDGVIMEGASSSGFQITFDE